MAVLHQGWRVNSEQICYNSLCFVALHHPVFFHSPIGFIKYSTDMKLEALNIQNFRSIQEVTVENCGEFNVIVGKNNAGKSNILLAINAFFQSLRKGEPIILKPPIGNSIDHYNNLVGKQIEITIFFQLSLAERDNLIQDIVSELPQVKNSVNGINSELRLAVNLEFTSFPEQLGYVKKMALCKPNYSILSEESVVHTILEIGPEAAKELSDKAKRSQELENEIEQINIVASERFKRLDEDDWNRLKANPSAFLERFLFGVSSRARITRPTGNLLNRLESLIQSLESKGDFPDAASSLIESMQQEAFNLRTEPIRHRINSFSGQETSVPIYVLNLMKKIGEMNVLYLTERREPIGKREASQLLDLKITRGGPEKLRAIQNTVSALLGVDIDAFRAKKTSSVEDPEAELDVDQFLVQVNGAGIREALRLILDYELNRPNILLVEEPEIHLHPALETSMMRYLKTIGKDCQIFITTHSTNFLDTAEMRNVYLASRDNSTTIQLINVEEAEQSVPRELGIRLSSLFMFDRLVFVEGPTDEDVIREWAFICGINLAQASVGFVPMGGVRNLAHFATEATINFLSKRRVSVFFMLDRDEREESEIKHLTMQLGNKAKLIVLNKRELENYLLSPKAIAKFIDLKHQLTGRKENKAINEDEIAQAIDKCADELKNCAIERRVAKITCRPILLNRDAILNPDSVASLANKLKEEYNNQKEKLTQLEKEIESVIEAQTQLVESKWVTKKRDLVPGDILLDNLCKLFGVRFNKERDSARLASLMEESEIDSEIKTILRTFAD
ncbi:AAA family ATPase [Richelia sinica]|nr:AAA family ATPase [Richelia sinica]MBD2667021.1 AAA family ATPase [Richelia sinica FACHB-800]